MKVYFGDLHFGGVNNLFSGNILIWNDAGKACGHRGLIGSSSFPEHVPRMTKKTGR